MDIKEIKRLATELSTVELEQRAAAFENSGELPPGVNKEPGDYLSDLLQAIEVKLLVEKGMTLSEAVREFSKRVRSSINEP